ncbi:hypothetical protein Taro_000247, partial [Colocasia esculenta]|nr:hypothetical protein [Colocasia esculenta]
RAFCLNSTTTFFNIDCKSIVWTSFVPNWRSFEIFGLPGRKSGVDGLVPPTAQRSSVSILEPERHLPHRGLDRALSQLKPLHADHFGCTLGPMDGRVGRL